MERYGIYAGVHRVRRELRDAEGRPYGLKPEAELLDGRRLVVMASWLIDDDPRYLGEWAMTFEYHRDDPVVLDAGLAWVASGDFESLEYVGPYGCAVPAA